MKQHHYLEVLAGLGLVALLAGGWWAHQPNHKQDRVNANLRIGTYEEVESLDSTRYKAKSSGQALANVMVGLYQHDQEGKVVPAIAKRVPLVSAHHLTYTFELRDYQWADGQAVTAADFVYAWRRLADPKTGSRNASRIDIIANGQAVRTGKLPVSALGVKALSDTKLQVRFSEATPYIARMLSHPAFLPIKQTFAEKLGDRYGTNSQTILTNGPYQMVGWDGLKDDTWQYIKNPRYYYAKRVKVPTIRIRKVTHDAASMSQFESGQLDYLPLMPEQIPTYLNDNTFRTSPTTAETFLYFNTTRGVTAEVALRKAIAQAFDKRLYVRSYLQNGSRALNGLIPYDTALTNDGKDYRKVTGDQLPYNLTNATVEWRKAKENLKMNHIPLTLTIADDPVAKRAAEFIKEQLQHNLPGLTITIDVVSFPERFKRETSGEFDLVLGVWNAADGDPFNLLTAYQSHNPLNTTGYSNAYYDQLVEAVYQSGDNLPERVHRVQSAERVLMRQEVPVAAFYQGGQAYLLNHRVKRLPILGTGYLNLEYACLE